MSALVLCLVCPGVIIIGLLLSFAALDMSVAVRECVCVHVCAHVRVRVHVHVHVYLSRARGARASACFLSLLGLCGIVCQVPTFVCLV